MQLDINILYPIFLKNTNGNKDKIIQKFDKCNYYLFNNYIFLG